MKAMDIGAAVLTIVGGVNWGLVALAEFDLVAWVFGQEFGQTTTLSRVVYGLVGVSALYLLARLPALMRGEARRPALTT